MGLGWDRGGTGMGQRWDWDETEVGLGWDIGGTGMGQRWDWNGDWVIVLLAQRSVPEQFIHHP